MEKHIIKYRDDALGCNRNSEQRHDYIPISWIVTPRAKHVTVIMCRHCFHRVNLEELFAHFPVELPVAEPEDVCQPT